MNGLKNFDKTDREYSLAPTDDLIRFWKSKVKVIAGRLRSHLVNAVGMCRLPAVFCWQQRGQLLLTGWTTAKLDITSVIDVNKKKNIKQTCRQTRSHLVNTFLMWILCKNFSFFSLSVTSRTCGAQFSYPQRSVLSPASSEFLDRARHQLATAYIDGVQSANHLQAQSALANRPMTIWRVHGCHVLNLIQIHSKLWPCIRNKETDSYTRSFGFLMYIR